MKTAPATFILTTSLILAAAGNAQAQQRAPGLAPIPNSAEGGLWASSERAERAARSSAELNPDQALNDYVREVTCRVASDYCSELRVYVMDRPAFNASAAPNGYIEVWSGLILRASSEAELAFVIGHEIGHYAENHSLERWNTTKGWMTAAMVVTAGAGIVGAYYQVDLTSVGDLAYLTALSSVFSYGRGQETQSDQLGFERIVTAGYDANAPVQIWRSQQAEAKASSFRSVRQADAAGSVFRTHPLTENRIAALAALAASHPDGGRTEGERYRAVIRPHLSAWLADEMNKRDFNGLLYLIDRLDDVGDLGVLNFYRGEVYRQRREESDAIAARDAYTASSGFPDAPVAVWRELGDMQVRLGDAASARLSYERYLELAIAADDRWIVEDSLNTLDDPS
ncbi:M48 family metalloprotease [Brevundimonas sp. TWP2-3-2]|uniref:M48 family metalloprotease n=1 Tax=Brevundimonas sp. TWP2-3-2 TaxID=2804648 RepID=UPI003CE9CAC6